MNSLEQGARPIFICGVGRSGTSLVQSMLASHSCVSFPPETSFLRRLVASGAIARALKVGDEDSVLDMLESDQRIERAGISGAELLAGARAEGAVTGGSLYRSLLRLYALSLGKPRYGDKDPRGIEYLALVVRALPGVHVINVIRDPRDILASKRNAAWSKGKNSLYHIFANRVQLKIGRRQGRRLLGRNYHEIVYEALINDPVSVLTPLCSQLGLTFEAGMLDFGDSAKRLVSECEMDWKKETLGPLLNNNHDKWQHRLKDWEVALTELVCIDAFEAGNYVKCDRIRQIHWVRRTAVYAAMMGMQALDVIYRGCRRRYLWRAIKYV